MSALSTTLEWPSWSAIVFSAAPASKLGRGAVPQVVQPDRRQARLVTGYQQLVVERSIPFRSLCEHHFLPFTGHAYVAYLPGERILGLSKLARVVEMFAHRPQVQERLTQQVADWLDQHLRPQGTGVVLVAEHLCMTLRGARAAGSTTVTSALHGVLLDDHRAREEFFALAAISS